jgi:hypothetical protein
MRPKSHHPGHYHNEFRLLFGAAMQQRNARDSSSVAGGVVVEMYADNSGHVGDVCGLSSIPGESTDLDQAQTVDLAG